MFHPRLVRGIKFAANVSLLLIRCNIPSVLRHDAG